MIFVSLLLGGGLLVFLSGLRILKEYERGVVFRLGRLQGARTAGLTYVIPWVEVLEKVDLRIVTLDVPPQDTITRDNVTIKVNAVVYFRVVDPNRALVEVENYFTATSALAQTTLRSVLGQIELDELLSSREAVNHRLQNILEAQTEPWGVKVSHVEVKQIDLPAEMQRAMARQAEAERERRAKVISAAGELEASQKLSEAAEVMSRQPVSLQLRYLQTLLEMSSEQHSTIVLPLPMDLLTPFLRSSDLKPSQKSVS